MQQWEETFLPHVLERLPIPVPPSPNDSQEEADFTQPYEEHTGSNAREGEEGVHASVRHPQDLQHQQGNEITYSDTGGGSEEQHALPQDQNTQVRGDLSGQAVTSQPQALEPSASLEEEELLQPMQERSLRNCCARIVRPSGPTPAMRPFRA